MAGNQKQSIHLRLATALQIHQTITQECKKHVSCEDCTCANPDGPVCGILYAPEIKRTRKLRSAFPVTFEDHCLF